MQGNTSSLIKSNGSKIVYLKSIIMITILFAIIFVETVFKGSYLDEFLGILAFLYLVCSIKRISKTDFTTMVLIFIIVSIGLMSNLVFQLNNNIFSILVDVLTQFKTIFAYYAVKYYFTDNEKKEVFNFLIPAAKLFAIFSLIFGAISQFVDIGMSGGERYGINAFKFFFEYNFQYTTVFMIAFAVFVCNTKMNKKSRIRYYIISLIAISFSTKSPAIVFIVCFIFLYFYFRKHEKLSLKILIPIAIGIIIFGSIQINEYLLDDTAPRRLFFDYAIVTANRFFPLGSGFATYGSAQAARDYSVLYYEYGFNEMWGLSPEYPMFLNDNYWQTIIGQFGYFGFVLFIILYLRIFNSLPNKTVNFPKKAFMYADFAQYLIHAIGAAIITNACGMIGFMILALCTTKAEATLERKLPKLKFNLRKNG